MGISVDKSNVAESIKDLRTFLLNGELADRDRSFATDLISGKYGYDVRGYLTENQMFYVGPMLERALGVEPVVEVEAVGSLEGLVKFFTDAKTKLKFPKITLKSKGEPLKLTVAGPKAKFPGTINITDGGPWGDNKWYGRVTAEGEWTPSKNVTPELKSIISRVLNSFSINPQNAAMTYGKISQHCCFCHKQLDTKESKFAGYGPVCAGNYGLPWGDTE